MGYLSNLPILPTVSRTSMYIGKSTISGNGNLEGYIDDFAMYNVGLL